MFDQRGRRHGQGKGDGDSDDDEDGSGKKKGGRRRRLTGDGDDEDDGGGRKGLKSAKVRLAKTALLLNVRQSPHACLQGRKRYQLGLDGADADEQEGSQFDLGNL